MEKEKIIEKLKEVVDPELGYNVVDLGLIYGIETKGKKVKVIMGLTSPFCPFAWFLVKQAEEKLRELGLDAEVEISNEPWSPERMSPELRKKLGLEKV